MRELRVFLASSAELEEERDRFGLRMKSFGLKDHVARNVKIIPVQWETDAYGSGAEVNETIQRTVEFENLDVVILIVWNKIGDGTLNEYETALALDQARRSPRLFVFAKESGPDANAEAAKDVREFKERVIRDGGVPTHYSKVEEFYEKVEAILEAQIFQPLPDHDVPILRQWYTRTAIFSFAMAVVALFLVSLMSFPRVNVSHATVLAILILCPLTSLSSMMALAFLNRLLTALRDVWRSPGFRDAAIYREFREVVPSFFMPRELRRRFSASWVAAGPSLLLLVFATVPPIVAEYRCIFDEMTTWDVTVTHDVAVERQPDPVPYSRFVEGGRRTWFFGFRDPDIRMAHQAEARKDGSVVYVHAHGKFGAELSVQSNRGPEVFLIWQPWIYTFLFAGHAGMFAALWLRLARYDREFALVETGKAP